MIGEKIYYLDFKNKKVSSGIVIGSHITTTGYGAYLVRTDEGDVQKEMSICYLNENEANNALKYKLPIAEEMNKLIEETNRIVNELRLDIIGEPPFKDLVEK